MTDKSIDSIKSKIKKLLALSEGNTTDAESMQAYRLTMNKGIMMVLISILIRSLRQLALKIEYKEYKYMEEIYNNEDSFLDQIRKSTIDEFHQDLEGDTSISNLIRYLNEASKIGYPGRCSTCTHINKEVLRLASVYLQDYLYILENQR